MLDLDNVRAVIVPWPVFVPEAGSSFPRVVGERHQRHGKTPTGWPPKQGIPDRSRINDMLNEARRAIAAKRERQRLAELEQM
jgi:hypothetical protein